MRKIPSKKIQRFRVSVPERSLHLILVHIGKAFVQWMPWLGGFEVPSYFEFGITSGSNGGLKETCFKNEVMIFEKSCVPVISGITKRYIHSWAIHI